MAQNESTPNTENRTKILIRPLSKELQKIAENELNEDPNRIQEELKQLKDWLAEQPHLTVRAEDQWLLSFLRGCKHNFDRTKLKLDTYYTMRSTIPEFFSNRDPFLPEIQEILRLGCFWLPLPKLAHPGAPRVLFTGNAMLDPKKVHVADVMKVNLMVMDILINEDDNFIVAGQHVFQDLVGMTMGYVLQMSPSFLKRTTVCFHQAYPGRSKGIHYVSAPIFSETLFNIIKAFLSEKIKKRITIRGGADYDVHDDIPRSLFPNEFGGEAGPFEDLRAEWKNKIESYRDWFQDDAKYCSDETKRPKNPKSKTYLDNCSLS